MLLVVVVLFSVMLCTYDESRAKTRNFVAFRHFSILCYTNCHFMLYESVILCYDIRIVILRY